MSSVQIETHAWWNFFLHAILWLLAVGTAVITLFVFTPEIIRPNDPTTQGKIWSTDAADPVTPELKQWIRAVLILAGIQATLLFLHTLTGLYRYMSPPQEYNISSAAKNSSRIQDKPLFGPVAYWIHSIDGRLLLILIMLASLGISIINIYFLIRTEKSLTSHGRKIIGGLVGLSFLTSLGACVYLFHFGNIITELSAGLSSLTASTTTRPVSIYRSDTWRKRLGTPNTYHR